MVMPSAGVQRSILQRVVGYKYSASIALLLLVGLIWLSRSLFLDAPPDNSTSNRRRRPFVKESLFEYRHPLTEPLTWPKREPGSKMTIEEAILIVRAKGTKHLVKPEDEPSHKENVVLNVLRSNDEKKVANQTNRVPVHSSFAGLDPDEILKRVAAEPEITFLSIGDWGRNTPQKTLLAGAMAEWSEKERASFILSCGDSFYSSSTHKTHGIASVDDPYIKECFEDVFHHSSLQRKWFISIGNHDYPPHAPKTNIDAQVAYTNLSKRWYLPAPYYTYRVQAKGWSVEVFVLDHYDPREYNSIKTTNPYPIQLPWLDRKLQESTAEWKIVLCHRPFYSSGSWHGSYPQWKKAIYPVLMKHRVQVYFAGDDHILEALKDSAGLVHIVSGAGSHMHTFGRTDRNSLFKFKEHGFTLHKMNRTHLLTKLIDFHGKVLYEFTTTQDEVKPKKL